MTINEVNNIGKFINDNKDEYNRLVEHHKNKLQSLENEFVVESSDSGASYLYCKTEKDYCMKYTLLCGVEIKRNRISEEDFLEAQKIGKPNYSAENIDALAAMRAREDIKALIRGTNN